MGSRFELPLLKLSASTFEAMDRRRASPKVRALLRHNFLFDEPRAASIDRLRRELEWLGKTFTMLSVAELMDGLKTGNLAENGAVFTTDDAHLDVFEVHEEFQAFGVPLSMYIPIGWVSSVDGAEAGFQIEAITLLQWYEGNDVTIRFGNGLALHLSPESRPAHIDRIVANDDEIVPHLEEICAKIAALPGSHRQRKKHRTTCTWSELAQLSAAGVHIGAHSVSHVRLAQASPIRKVFEVGESKRVLENKLGSCTTFAYPFGTPDSYDGATQAALKQADYSLSFLTHSDVIAANSPLYELPRIFIPDRPLPLNEYSARVRGAGILPQRIKSSLGR